MNKNNLENQIKKLKIKFSPAVVEQILISKAIPYPLEPTIEDINIYQSGLKEDIKKFWPQR